MDINKIFVILDDGHGKSTQGKRSPQFEERVLVDGLVFEVGDHFIENYFNCPVCDQIEIYLKNIGIGCVQTAPSHKDVSLDERIAREHKYYNEAKQAGKETVFVSIHANAHTEDWNNANGIETYSHPTSQNGSVLAEKVQNRMISSTGRRNRGVKTSPVFKLVRESKSPCILVEGGFMTNKEEVLLLASRSYQNKIARSVIDGIIDYVNYK
jgi:N-acetylmuramoyl-L-alanine amidase